MTIQAARRFAPVRRGMLQDLQRLAQLTLLPCLLAAPAAADCTELAPLDWLLGAWRADAGKTVITERWSRASAVTFEGLGEQQAGDRRVRESLRLVEMSGKVFYLAKVDENPLPVAFELTTCVDGRYLFENPAHGFPRQIEYLRDRDAGFRVKVSNRDGSGFQLDFAPLD